MKEGLGGGENLRARYEREERGKMHFSNLHDEDETVTGDLIDPATGKPYDNSTQDPGAPELHVVEADERTGDALPPLLEEEDEATRWIREHSKD